MTRLNTNLEASGAEFIVLGHLLIHGIPAYKTYTNMPGYDLTATHPEEHKSARIQVKSRWATDYDGGFIIRNLNCDFVVLAALNRGYRYSKRRRGNLVEQEPPKMYVFPIDVVTAAKATGPKSTWGKVYKRNIPNSEDYLERWDLIRSFLGISSIEA